MNATTRPDGGTTPESSFATSKRAGVPGQDLPAGDPAPRYTPAPPYTLDAVCELSEDYFLVQNHDIDPVKDTVIAYSRADGQVEAMVLQDGKVLQVYRDATQAGGWAVLALPGADGVIDMVAGMSSPGYGSAKGAVLKVFYVKSASPAQLNVAVETKPPAPGTPATFTTHDPVPWLDTTFNYNNASFTDDHTQGRLQIALNFDSGLLVTAIKASAADTSGNDAKMCFWTDTMTVEASLPDQPIPVSHGVLDGFHYYPIISGFRAAAMVADDWTTSKPYIYLYVPDAVSKREMTVWGWQLHSNRTSGTMTNTNIFLLSPTTLPEDNTYVIGVENLSVVGAALMPTALIWTKRYGSPADTRLWACTFDTGHRTWHWIELPVPDAVRAREDVPTVSTALTPRSQADPDHLGAHTLLDVFLVIDGTLHVFRQVETTSAEADGITPAYTPIIPLQPGVAMMTSQPCISTGDQLMIVSVSPNSPGTLQALEKDPLTGWSGHPVHLEHTQEMQQDSAYRVQLTLSDAWNAGLAGAELSITASSQAVARVEGKIAGNPQTAVLGPTPVKLTADGGGEVSLALLADGLSAPALTITADKLPGPVTVYPSDAVNTYLSGDTKQQLNYLDPLDEQTLTDAKTPQTDGQPAVLVAPEASKPGYAASAIANMTGAATEAQNKANQGMVAATLGRTDGGRLAYLGQRHLGVGSGTGVSVQSGQTDINNWTHDVLHAIKKGAAKVSTVTKDLEHDVYKLATDLADWTEDEVNVTVDGIEAAAHVIHAEFNRLGGEIVHAVKWLEAEVIGVFHSAKDLSDRFETWIADFGGFAATMADSSKTAAENWLTGKKDDVTNELTTLTGRFSDDANMKNMADKPPEQVSTRRRPSPGGPPQPAIAPLRDTDDDQKQPAHGDWFYQKIKHELAGSGLKINLFTMPDLKDKITAFGEQALAHSGGFQNKFIDDLWTRVIVHYVQHPDDVNQMPLKPLLDGVIAVIDDAFDLAEKVVAAAFDLLSEIARSISKMLSDTTLGDLPILGGLMKLIGLGEVSIGRVANLIFAFPAALVYKIAHGADAQPFATRSLGSRHRQAIGDEVSDLQICAASVMGTWAVFDTASAAFVAADDDGGILFAGVDIAAPLIVTILTTPASKDGEPFFAPPVSSNASDVMGFVAWIFGAIPALCAALPLVYEKTIADDAQKRESYTQVTLWIQTLTGVVALIFGMIANSDKAQPKGSDYAGAVLNNMPTIAGAGLTNVLSEPTAGISVVVTMALTLICGEIGATVYGVDG